MLLELFLAQHGVSDEFRAMLADEVAALAKAFLQASKHDADLGSGENILLDEKVDQSVGNSKAESA